MIVKKVISSDQIIIICTKRLKGEHLVKKLLDTKDFWSIIIPENTYYICIYD